MQHKHDLFSDEKPSIKVAILGKSHEDEMGMEEEPVFSSVDSGQFMLDLDEFPELDEDRLGDEVELIVKGTVLEKTDEKITIKPMQADVVHGRQGGKFITKAIKKPGALRSTAKRMGLLEDEEDVLSASDLSKLASKAKKSDNLTLLRRVNLARTLSKLRRR